MVSILFYFILFQVAFFSRQTLCAVSVAIIFTEESCHQPDFLTHCTADLFLFLGFICFTNSRSFYNVSFALFPLNIYTEDSHLEF